MKKTLAVLKRLHEDDRGAEGLEKLLIIAVIVLPLLAVLIGFRKVINAWVVSLWQDIKGEADDPIIRP